MAGKERAADTMSKMEAVRKALKELGKDAKPIQIQSYVKERFGIDMSADHCSNYKSVILRKSKGKGKRLVQQAAARSTETPESSTGTNRPTARPQSNAKSASISLEDVEATKALIGRVGVDNLRKLIDLLTR